MNLMVAADDNWAIGNKNELLIAIPADHRLFRQETEGKVVVYGRKTLSTFPQKMPLPGRVNVILSSSRDFQVKGAKVAHDLEELFEELRRIAGSKNHRLARTASSYMNLTFIRKRLVALASARLICACDLVDRLDKKEKIITKF